MSKILKLISGDPGKSNDPFGVVGLVGTWPERKIIVTHAKQFKRKSYARVANHFKNQWQKNDLDLLLIEKNFDYENVSKAFSDLPITYVSTSGTLTEKSRAKGWAVDKPYMIGWLKDEYKAHTIKWPEIKNADMQELIDQRAQIVPITAPSGHVTYKAQRGRHDDLFMAKLIGCNAIRIWWDQQ